MLRPLLLLLLAGAPACAQTRADAAAASAPSPAQARPFTMRAYQVVILHRGPAWSPAQTPETAALFAGHMAHLQRQTAAGKLVLAGPFTVAAEGAPADAAAGLCVYAVETAEEARALAEQDPAVKAGRFTLEVLPWYGPAGLRYDGMEAFVADGPPK
jgi:uncharacterized protein